MNSITPTSTCRHQCAKIRGTNSVFKVIIVPASAPDLQKPLPQRHEIPVDLTWNLDPIYTSDTAWESDFAQLEQDIELFAPLQNTLAQSAQQLLQVLELRDRTGILIGKLRSYASLRKSEDNANAQSQARADRIQMLGTKRAATFFSSDFVSNRFIFNSGGRLAANSITLWSKNGERASSEFAIDAMSTFTRISFGR